MYKRKLKNLFFQLKTQYIYIYIYMYQIKGYHESFPALKYSNKLTVNLFVSFPVFPKMKFRGSGGGGANTFFFVAIDSAEFLVFTKILKQIFHQQLQNQVQASCKIKY